MTSPLGAQNGTRPPGTLQPTLGNGYKPCIGIFRDIVRVAGLGVGEIEVRAETLDLPAWPQSLSGLRVAVVADLHAGAPQIDEERIERIVARVNRERVDLVALLGDYVDHEVALAEKIDPAVIAGLLSDLDAPAVAVLGNHDWAHTGPRMGQALRDAGITLLENQAIEHGGFWIAGLGDLIKREADLEGTLAQVPDGAPVLLFSHNPDVFPRVPASVALTLSGHTHGAQVDIPVLRDKFTPSRFGARYTGGHIEEDGRHLFVSDGIGTSRLPVRFRAKPKLPVLELRAWNSASH